MRILHLITWLRPGGIEKWLLSVLRYLPREGYALDICCKAPRSLGDPDLIATARAHGVNVIQCPLGPMQLGFLRGLHGILRRGNYNLVHNHLELYSGLPVLAARHAKIPVITSYHNTAFPPQSWARYGPLPAIRDVYGKISINYALKSSDLVTGCSEAVLSNVKADHHKLSNFRTLYYGVDVPPLATPEEKAEFRLGFGWPADTPVILHVGRFVEQKNHAGILAIFRQVLECIPEAKLILVGSPNSYLFDTVKQMAVDMGLNDSVCFLGARDDVPHLMAVADVFVFPSLFEGFGLVALEANAAALAVVGSDIPGLNEAVVNGETALLHRVDDIKGMADSVVLLLTNPEYAAHMGQLGRLRVLREFSVQASASTLMGLYDECLGLGKREVCSHAG